MDCGRVVNPDTIKAQMEGGVVFGLSAALHGAITFKNGRVEQSNFHNYRLLTMEEMPEVEVYIVPSSEAPVVWGSQVFPHRARGGQCRFCRHRQTDSTITHQPGRFKRSLADFSDGEMKGFLRIRKSPEIGDNDFRQIPRGRIIFLLVRRTHPRLLFIMGMTTRKA